MATKFEIDDWFERLYKAVEEYDFNESGEPGSPKVKNMILHHIASARIWWFDAETP